MVKRFMAPGPWITRDLKECVRASDYDALLAEVDRLREWQRKMIDAVNSGKIYLIHALIEETDHDNRQ